MKLVIALCAALAMTGCTAAEFKAANDALEQQMYATHGGPLGWGADAALLSMQINALRGR